MKVQELIDKLNLIENKDLDIEFLYNDNVEDVEYFVDFDKITVAANWVTINLKWD